MTTLGGVTIAAPDAPMNVTRVMIGEDTRSQDGTLLRDWIAKKLQWNLRWSLLTDTEYATLDARLNVLTAQVFRPPDPDTAPSFTVLVDYNSYTSEVILDAFDNEFYNVTVTLIEA